MAITKSKKKEIFESVEEAVKGSDSMVFVNFHGLKVADANQLRRKLESEGVGYLVAKKTITKKAVAAHGVKGEMPELEGELALAYSKDLIAPAREVYEFQKKLKEGLKILGGIFEGKFMSKDEMVAIAAIPSMNTLRGMFVNVINSPIQGLVISLAEISKKKPQ
jgi:large subunit ribosomal protein L10